MLVAGMARGEGQKSVRNIMTVRGPVPATELGRVLCHEHILVDFIGAKETGYHRWNRDEVARIVEPKLREGYLSIATKLLPALTARGISDGEITQLLHGNVIDAFALRE